ncbi:hypothetical protein GCM10027074_74200 [Streptomyces deserti]
MERRSVRAAGVTLPAASLVRPEAGWAAPALRLSADDVAASRQLFAAGSYAQLTRTLPLLLDAASHSAQQRPADHEPEEPRPRGGDESRLGGGHQLVDHRERFGG